MDESGAGEPGNGRGSNAPGVDDLEDVDRLWSMLLEARRAGADDLAARIKGRMAQLERRRRYASLSDSELDARIHAIEDASTIDVVKRSGVTEESVMNRHIDDLNERMARGNRPEAADHLPDLLAERQRRRA